MATEVTSVDKYNSIQEALREVYGVVSEEATQNERSIIRKAIEALLEDNLATVKIGVKHQVIKDKAFTKIPINNVKTEYTDIVLPGANEPHMPKEKNAFNVISYFLHHLQEELEGKFIIKAKNTLVDKNIVAIPTGFDSESSYVHYFIEANEKNKDLTKPPRKCGMVQLTKVVTNPKITLDFGKWVGQEVELISPVKRPSTETE